MDNLKSGKEKLDADYIRITKEKDDMYRKFESAIE